MIKVDVGAVADTGIKLVGNAGELDDFLKRVLNEVIAAQGGWQGRGCEGFGSLHERWNRAAAELQLVLHQFGGATKTAAENYDQTDVCVANNFGGGAA